MSERLLASILASLGVAGRSAVPDRVAVSGDNAALNAAERALGIVDDMAKHCCAELDAVVMRHADLLLSVEDSGGAHVMFHKILLGHLIAKTFACSYSLAKPGRARELSVILRDQIKSDVDRVFAAVETLP